MISYIKASGGAHGLNEKSLGKGPIERAQRVVLVGIALVCYILMPYGRVGNLAVLNSIFVLLLLLSIVTILRRYRAVHRSN
jgi:formate hydrogenlyase subunit 4